MQQGATPSKPRNYYYKTAMILEEELNSSTPEKIFFVSVHFCPECDNAYLLTRTKESFQAQNIICPCGNRYRAY